MPESTFEFVFLIGFVAGSVIRAVYTGRRRCTRVGRMGPDELLMTLAGVGLIVVPLVYLLSPWLDFADYHLPTWAGWAGAATFAAALYLLWRSHVDLGPNWSPILEIKEDHTLVTEGVYRRVRHPMYTAHLLWAIAQLLLLENWIAGPAFLATFVLLCVYRVPREERMLLAHFGEEYRSYMARTGRLLPPVWR